MKVGYKNKILSLDMKYIIMDMEQWTVMPKYFIEEDGKFTCANGEVIKIEELVNLFKISYITQIL